MKERDNLHPEKTDDGRNYLRPASYTLSKEEKKIMFECLSSMKVTSGFSCNMRYNKCAREEITKYKVT